MADCKEALALSSKPMESCKSAKVHSMRHSDSHVAPSQTPCKALRAHFRAAAKSSFRRCAPIIASNAMASISWSPELSQCLKALLAAWSAACTSPAAPCARERMASAGTCKLEQACRLWQIVAASSACSRARSGRSPSRCQSAIHCNSITSSLRSRSSRNKASALAAAKCPSSNSPMAIQAAAQLCKAFAAPAVSPAASNSFRACSADERASLSDCRRSPSLVR
mmetsp:Transcript_12087/g.32374  ORF Transcript_12087/g.32374 Transcript_12087/m.32374 type:complete len:224 (-) Transcript_12087:648-1319(-)